MTCVVKIVTPSLKTGKGDLANQMSLGKIHCQRTLLFPLHVKVCEIRLWSKVQGDGSEGSKCRSLSLSIHGSWGH